MATAPCHCVTVRYEKEFFCGCLHLLLYNTYKKKYWLFRTYPYILSRSSTAQISVVFDFEFSLLQFEWLAVVLSGSGRSTIVHDCYMYVVALIRPQPRDINVPQTRSEQAANSPVTRSWSERAQSVDQKRLRLAWKGWLARHATANSHGLPQVNVHACCAASWEATVQKSSVPVPSTWPANLSVDLHVHLQTNLR